jgi:GT2 family glycosyltransferase
VLSVIVPTRLSGGMPPRTLASLSHQDVERGRLELIVVVDGVPPERVTPLRSLPWPFPAVVIEQAHSGQASARNRGAEEARGDRLVFVDDDVELPPDFLRRVDQAIDEGADLVVPDIRIGEWVPDTVPVREARRAHREYEERRPADADVRFDDVVFAATGIRRSWFDRVGGFDFSFTAAGAYGNEDVDLTYRLLREGAVARWTPAAVAYTDEPHELSRLLTRARLVGRNDVRLVRKHPELAAEVLGRKLVDSRIQRLVGTAVMGLPVLSSLDGPLRWAVARFVHTADDGPLRFRLWFVLRAIHYWRGVADAGGGPIARAARRAAAAGSDDDRRGRAVAVPRRSDSTPGRS